MKLKERLKTFIPPLILARLGFIQGSGGYKYSGSLSVKEDILSKYNFSGDLLSLFTSNTLRPVRKWHHYIPLYDRYFSPFRGTKVRFLEIGVSEGGSLKMWRSYFGQDALIFGVDIDPNCLKFNGIDGQVRIGSQDDSNFLETVLKEMGGIDIVLDDGSHQMSHIRSTFELLFPRLNQGGIYMIEDLHTAYWRGWGGGYTSESNFFKFISSLVDDMHHWYHHCGQHHPKISQGCSGVHVHDSIAVFEKNTTYPPVYSEIPDLSSEPVSPNV